MSRRTRAARQQAPAPVAPKRTHPVISAETLALSRMKEQAPVALFNASRPAPGVLPKDLEMAFDSAFGGMSGWANENLSLGGGMAFGGNVSFLGYPFLAELAQRPEYRRISEVVATEMTRKWIRISTRGDEDKSEQIKELNLELERLCVRQAFQKAAALDGFFGRAHLYLDTGDTDDRAELMTPIGNGRDKLSVAKVKKGGLLRIGVIEPAWTYPTEYNSNNPLKASWYKPQSWFVLGTQLHGSRLLTLIGREVPDTLKPAYMFGGLSMSQMALPYVNNWLRTRQSVADIISAFSTFVLGTNLSESTQMNGEQLFNRAALFNNLRDNRGLLMVDKESETFENVSAPLGSLDALQAQTQEHLCVQSGTLIETARGHIAIENLNTDDYVITRNGPAPIDWVGVTGYSSNLIEICAGNIVLRVTECHPIWSETTQSFVDAKNVNRSDLLLKSRKWENTVPRSFGVADIGGIPKLAITETKKLAAFCIALCGSLIVAPSTIALRYTTEMRTAQTTIGKTSNCLIGFPTGRAIPLFSSPSLVSFVANAATHSRHLLSGLCTALRRAERALANCRADGSPFEKKPSNANIAEKNPRRENREPNTVLADVCNALQRFAMVASSILSTLNLARSADHRSSRTVPTSGHAQHTVVGVRKLSARKVKRQPVYNVKVADGYAPEFFANGILVHNCTVSGIPIVKLLGIQPSGMNASSQGELETFYTNIGAYQEHLFREPLTRIMGFAQLSLWGKVDPDLTFVFEPLWSMTDKELAEVEKIKAETDQIKIDSGVISPMEARKRTAADPDSEYDGIDVEDEPDLLDEEERGGLEPVGGKPNPFAEQEAA